MRVPTGIEFACELAKAARVTGWSVKITLLAASDHILPMLKTNQKVSSAMQNSDSGEWKVTLSNGGGELDTDLYIPTTGVLLNNEFISVEFLDENEWVVVDKELRS
ncbi:hypothetical protein BDV33DRAFT_210234 [Aspergillus novoparasiticus]|uniref:Uncharacterized protein n=1 Tax=Aspergillus novoparasiticus TaxID=986946 RepID=A0A5N6E760_9EURO|nr:hypothetical protein BDV33DRAFT_210234 [Aspergillus novoparasiticus]